MRYTIHIENVPAPPCTHHLTSLMLAKNTPAPAGVKFFLGKRVGAKGENQSSLCCWRVATRARTAWLMRALRLVKLRWAMRSMSAIRERGRARVRAARLARRGEAAAVEPLRGRWSVLCWGGSAGMMWENGNGGELIFHGVDIEDTQGDVSVAVGGVGNDEMVAALVFIRIGRGSVNGREVLVEKG